MGKWKGTTWNQTKATAKEQGTNPTNMSSARRKAQKGSKQGKHPPRNSRENRNAQQRIPSPRGDQDTKDPKGQLHKATPPWEERTATPQESRGSKEAPLTNKQGPKACGNGCKRDDG